MGGGTLDVTLLSVTDGVVRSSLSEGDLRCGGYDVDLALAQLLRRKRGIEKEVEEVEVPACHSLCIYLSPTNVSTYHSLSGGGGGTFACLSKR